MKKDSQKLVVSLPGIAKSGALGPAREPMPRDCSGRARSDAPVSHSTSHVQMPLTKNLWPCSGKNQFSLQRRLRMQLSVCCAGYLGFALRHMCSTKPRATPRRSDITLSIVPKPVWSTNHWISRWPAAAGILMPRGGSEWALGRAPVRHSTSHLSGGLLRRESYCRLGMMQSVARHRR